MVGLSKARVESFLGKPNKRLDKVDEYLLSADEELRETKKVQIHYSPAGVADKFEIIEDPHRRGGDAFAWKRGRV